ncbi:Hypothetical protein SRAE_2000378900 [Strongyloides ratti]|uniref:Uncharacterized protein n=1 Tax=Strongyloides ratti TaxID=34506 RepID=A0A090LH84_STRRB|nr:Hypothetical protein SRAE_2000378900 [Strongyloides ratti]CEF69137.1 Hypothetical protein SRAE_2000378900 [Strongyloides ratti]
MIYLILSMTTAFWLLPNEIFSLFYCIIVIVVVTFITLDCSKNVDLVAKKNKAASECTTSKGEKLSKLPTRNLPDHLLLDAMETCRKNSNEKNVKKPIKSEKIVSSYATKEFGNVDLKKESNKETNKNDIITDKKNEVTAAVVKDDKTYVDLARLKNLEKMF